MPKHLLFFDEKEHALRAAQWLEREQFIAAGNFDLAQYGGSHVLIFMTENELESLDTDNIIDCTKCTMSSFNNSVEDEE